jgi:hypothetical protein
MSQTLVNLFGDGATFNESAKTVTFDLNNFKNIADGGKIMNSLGMNNLAAITATNVNNYAAKIFYGLLVLLSQQQSATINDDSTEAIYLTQGGIRIATGTRNGQVQRVISINVFDTANTVGNIVDIDNI